MSWPDGGTTPFRGEKNTNWEGGYRVPFVIRWPGTVKPGSVYNDILSLEDALPTLMAAAGQPDIKEQLVKGAKVGGANYKVHLDGYDFGPYFRGETNAGPRHEFFYWTDDGDVAGLRYDQYKLVFMEQRAHGYEVWQDPMVTLRLPKLFNLRTDPFERADHEGIDYPKWRLERAYLLVPAQAIVGGFLQTLQQFPPRQKPGSFSLGDAMDKIQAGSTGGSN